MNTFKIPQYLPDGTTHFCRAFGRYPTRAFKLKACDQWSYWTGFDWQDLRHSPVPAVRMAMVDVRPQVTGPTIAELIDKGWLEPFKTLKPSASATWRGPEDGLPPIGLVCEATHEDLNGGKPVKAEILKHHENGIGAAFFWIGAPKGSRNLLWAQHFMPIRTPEQIAAEEREAEIAELVKAILPVKGEITRVIAVHLHSVGYRKFEITEYEQP